MKAWLALLLVAGGLVMPAWAQYDIPPPPGVKMKPRATGSGQGGVEVLPKDGGRKKVKVVTHVVLSESRVWTSTDGKPLSAKLLAFEDLVVESFEGEATPSLPEAPKHPTVVKEERVRLLVGGKAVEVALARLSQADRDFVEQIRQARQAPQ